MTATPKETKYISNLSYFGEPIYTYSLKEGIEDGFLAPFKVINIMTDIGEGWRPRKGQKDINGIEIPDRIYTNSDYDYNIIIEDRIQQVAEEITKYLKSTDRMAKTIVFCATEDAALRMRDALAKLNADMMKENPDYVVRITGGDDYGKGKLKYFISVSSPYPVIATTSKLLSTGADCKMTKLIVLDEMNLARIEYYFAEMLSVLEMPSKDEWVLDLVPTAWEGDPVKMDGGKIHVSDATWFVGTANNDDSTFTITDKVYDRAMPIELNERADAFECDPQPACYVTTEHLEYLFQKAKVEHPISDDLMDKMQKLDSYLVTRFKLSFGNRIMKQMYDFIPVYVACGGTELDAMDYIVARKVLKKFESMNVSFVRDEITGLINYIEKTFGKAGMEDSKSYLRRIQNLY